ncbi:head-tail connector protein [Halomonas caseinilytica]|uniref:Phage gp6-like head-tail connector protein n=1 Tax=Halomonas caseinilytica TaxID=438744 RepID=A0A1M6UHM2_9GAMM|nr:phage head-tail connector protein [Halomonas caseinilytica]SHK68677.1 phage conserved hypothetical protein, phiE125 gp8 family [Halomonas caseinilytica]
MTTVRSRRIVEPTEEPITLAEAKTQARIDHDHEDDFVASLIATARDVAEQRLGRALITQTWEQRGLPRDGVIELRRWPAIEVVSVEDAAGELAPEAWKAEVGEFPEVRLINYQGGPVTVTYTAGYGDAADDVPESIRRWMFVAVATMYEHREAEVTGTIVSSLGYVDNLLECYRVPAI